MFSSTDYFAMNRVKVKPDGSLDVPKRVIKNAATARSIYYVLRSEHLKRIYLYAEIDGLIAGNPPYDPEELKNAGLLHIANFNTLEPRAMYEKNAQSYWNLLFTSDCVINFSIDVKDPMAPALANKMSYHWDKVVREMWPSFDINVSVLTGQLVKYGISPSVWVNESSPYWRVVETNKFFVPDQSASDMDLLSICCVENEFPLVFLLEIYDEYKDNRTATNWNIDALEKFLAWKANAPYKDNPLPNDLVELQRKLYQGDIMYDRLYNESLRMVSLFYKEGDGTITHFMIHRDWSNKDPVEDGFLYMNTGQYKSWSQLFLLFTQSPGEQYIHGNRGLGQKMFPLCQAKMMMDNSLVDGGRWASTPIIKSPSMTVKEAESVRFTPGVMTNIGSMEFQQNNLGSNLKDIIGVSQYIGSMLDRNAAYSGDDSGKPDASTGSLAPDVFRMQAYKEFNVLRNQIAHFYKTFDALLEQMTVRMIHCTPKEHGYEMSKEWKDRCINDGVPEELLKAKKGMLPPLLRVKATRTAGAGSQVGYMIGLKEIEPLVGTFGKPEQVNYIEDRIKAAMGPEFVDRYTKSLREQDELGGGASVAQLENAIMQEGKSPLAEPANDNQTHIQVHFALGKQIVDAVTQEQMSPIDADKVFEVLIPHNDQHIQYLSGSIFAKSFLEGIKKDWYDLKKFAVLNKRNAEKALLAQQKKQEEDAAKTQTVMTDEQRKDFIAKRGEDRKDFVVKKTVQRADEANQTRSEVIKKKTDAEVSSIRAKTEAATGGKIPDNIRAIPASGGASLSNLINTPSNKSISPIDFS